MTACRGYKSLRLRVSLAAIVLSLAFFFAGCRQPQPVPIPVAPPLPATQNLIVLLPNEDGTVGEISISNSGVTRELTEPYAGVRVDSPDAPPGTPFKLDQNEIQRVLGNALDLMPSAEVSFNLYFLSNSAALDEPSQALLPEIFETIKSRRATDIEVIGHTDTTGNGASNLELGLKRAQAVADILRSMGMNTDNMSVSSHGDTDLLIQTPRGVSEPRNRRVEIIVR